LHPPHFKNDFEKIKGGGQNVSIDEIDEYFDTTDDNQCKIKTVPVVICGSLITFSDS
jgi:hypothetical protein